MISPVRILTGYTGADFVQWLWSSTVTWRGKQAPGCPLSRGTSSPAHSKSGIICFTNSSQLHDSIASVGEAKSEVPQTAQLIILRWVISPQKEGTWLSPLSATDRNWTLVLNSTPSAVADGALLKDGLDHWMVFCRVYGGMLGSQELWSQWCFTSSHRLGVSGVGFQTQLPCSASGQHTG